MKVSELTGAQLDYWVARALGTDHETYVKAGGKIWFPQDSDALKMWQPSSDWAQGGPIIEREKIELHVKNSDEWYGEIDMGVTTNSTTVHCCIGPTPLIAAMRAYVKSKFGEEVPEENGGKVHSA